MPVVVIDDVRPTVSGGTRAAKAIVGRVVDVSADIFLGGHDQLVAWLKHWPEGEPRRVTESSMVLVANDRWSGRFAPDRVGPWRFQLGAMVDRYGTLASNIRVKHEADQDLELELQEAAEAVERHLGKRAGGALRPSDERDLLSLLKGLQGGRLGSRVARAVAPETVALMFRTADRASASESQAFPVWVDRELAGFSAWYEMFPRSEGATPARSGSLASAAERLPGIAAMGFDIVYLPPIHPIGIKHRKGPNNSLVARPADVGSPWAIGAAEGGHTTVHPDLGSIEDFDAFVTAARAAGLEVALDYALQCSPDHPWVAEHPEWFSHRPDGSIRFAENPPKKYQDIYPLDFDTPQRAELWAALRGVLEHWLSHGVSVFRVDNPHTKPLEFWEWLITGIRAVHPQTIFLAEAFTRPRMMERLAAVGFTQSYTYFTWRNSRAELRQYLVELSQTRLVDYFRPNFWVNTPDILPEYLQTGGEPAFRIRAVLAALAGPSWGMYAGYELCENVPLRVGAEEYLDSEKYQLRPRDWNSPRSLAPYVARLNEVRRRHRGAIGSLHTLEVHHVDNDQVLCFSRRDPLSGDLLLVVVNLDPFNAQEGTTWLTLDGLGLEQDEVYEVVDELDETDGGTGTVYRWRGSANFIRLDPRLRVAHALNVRRVHPAGARA